MVYILVDNCVGISSKFKLLYEFHEKKHVTYNLRMQNLCELPEIRKKVFGEESLSFRGNFLWNALDDSAKNEPIFSAFRRRTKY